MRINRVRNPYTTGAKADLTVAWLLMQVITNPDHTVSSCLSILTSLRLLLSYEPHTLSLNFHPTEVTGLAKPVTEAPASSQNQVIRSDRLMATHRAHGVRCMRS